MTGLVVLDPVTGQPDLWLPCAAPPSGPGLLLSDRTELASIEELLDWIDHTRAEAAAAER